METIHSYNLSNLCRVCLSNTDSMFSLFDSSNCLGDLLRKIMNCELKRSTTLPNYICNLCKDKMMVCNEFIIQCEQTNQLLEKYKECDFKVENVNTDLASLPNTEIIEFISNDENSNDSNHSKRKIEDDKETSAKSRQLIQFSYQEVIEALDSLTKNVKETRSCMECKFEGRNFRSLSLHMTYVHKDLKNRWCMVCNSLFDNLKSHSPVHNVCQLCGKNVSRRTHLIEHLMSHTSIRPYKCDHCEKTFISTRYLRIHNITHTGEKPHKCNYCSCSYTQLHPLKMHMQNKHSWESNFTCVTCSQQFETEKALQEHRCSEQYDLNNLSIVKQNYCAFCRKNVRSLNAHTRKFHGNINQEDRPLKLCTICGKQFRTNTKLRVHMRVHTGETPYTCSYCDRKLATRHNLISHERIHTGARPHLCLVCNKTFSQKGVLNTHMKLHTGRPETCMICEKKFCRSTELRLHMRVHTGERPFNCSYCGKSFMQKSHLVEHMRDHSDDRPFHCVHCSKSFRRSSSLKDHIQIHLGKKPYKCNQCSYACTRSWSLTVHMRKHNEDATQSYRNSHLHICPYCSRSFSTSTMLNSHTSKVHSSVKCD